MSQEVYQKICLTCGVAKDVTEFDRSGTNGDGYRPRCRACRTAARRSVRSCGGCGEQRSVADAHLYSDRLCLRCTLAREIRLCVDCGKEVTRKATRCRLCSLHYRSGPRSATWLGGRTPINQRERTSQAARAWRRAIFARDNYTCQLCEKRGVTLHAHHKKAWATHPELRYDIENGITLCRDCHLHEVHQGHWGRPGLELWV